LGKKRELPPSAAHQLREEDGKGNLRGEDIKKASGTPLKGGQHLLFDATLHLVWQGEKKKKAGGCKSVGGGDADAGGVQGRGPLGHWIKKKNTPEWNQGGGTEVLPGKKSAPPWQKSGTDPTWNRSPKVNAAGKCLHFPRGGTANRAKGTRS